MIIYINLAFIKLFGCGILVKQRLCTFCVGGRVFRTPENILVFYEKRLNPPNTCGSAPCLFLQQEKNVQENSTMCVIAQESALLRCLYFISCIQTMRTLIKTCFSVKRLLLAKHYCHGHV